MNSRSIIFASALAAIAAVVLLLLFPHTATAEGLGSITINTNSGKELTGSEVFTGLKLSMIMTGLVFLPSLIMTATSFTRVAIVLALTRQALGTAQTPPNQVLLGLALFLTYAIMQPVFGQIYTDAIVPFTEDQIGYKEAMEKAFSPLRTFMIHNTRENDIALFVDIAKMEAPENPESLGPTVIIPAFVISELNSAFQIAFLIFLPFLILDMIISSVLTSMSMITLPPTVISLPIKLMLFVVIDGWHLIIGNLVKSYH